MQRYAAVLHWPDPPRGGFPPTWVRENLPVQFQRKLHLTRRVGLAGNLSKGVTVQVGVRVAENSPVQQVECLAAEIELEAFLHGEGFAQADVLVLIPEAAGFRIEASLVADHV